MLPLANQRWVAYINRKKWNMESRKTRSIKSSNRKKVLDLIRKLGDVSILELSMKTGVSKPTVKKIVDYYMYKNLIISVGKGNSTDEGGKKPELYKFNNEFGYVISIHITPDSIYHGITDLNIGFIDLQREIHSGNAKMEFVLDRVVSIIQNYIDSNIMAAERLIGIAIAFPGMVNPSDGLSIYSPHYHSWDNNYPFRSELLSRLGMEVDIFMDCTNRYQAFAEKLQGLGIGKDNFIIVDAIEEGLGAGIIVGGRIKHGAQNISGEIGHMILCPDSKIKCICGGEGCFEAMVSTKRILKNIRDGYEEHKDSLIFQGRDPRSIEMEHLFEALNNNDDFAKEIIDDVIKWFALGLSNVIVVYDPQMIIIQGIYVNAGDYFISNLRQQIKKLSLPRVEKNVVIEYSKLGWERGVIGGAAYVCWNYFEQDEVYRGAMVEMVV